MTYQRIIHKKVVSPDGKAIAEATSTVIVSAIAKVKQFKVFQLR